MFNIFLSKNYWEILQDYTQISLNLSAIYKNGVHNVFHRGDVTGSVTGGRVCAVMGPSGAGK